MQTEPAEVRCGRRTLLVETLAVVLFLAVTLHDCHVSTSRNSIATNNKHEELFAIEQAKEVLDGVGFPGEAPYNSTAYDSTVRLVRKECFNIVRSSHKLSSLLTYTQTTSSFL